MKRAPMGTPLCQPIADISPQKGRLQGNFMDGVGWGEFHELPSKINNLNE